MNTFFFFIFFFSSLVNTNKQAYNTHVMTKMATNDPEVLRTQLQSCQEQKELLKRTILDLEARIKDKEEVIRLLKGG